MPPTRRSTGCSVARSRSKSLSFQETFALKTPRICAAFFCLPSREVAMTARDRPIVSLCCASCCCACLHAAAAAPTPQNFLFAGSDELAAITALVARPDIGGVQIVYSWKSLETARDHYDFARDRARPRATSSGCTGSCSSRFRIVSSSRAPECARLPARRIPSTAADSCRSDNPGENKPEGHGWVAQQWNPGGPRSASRNCLQALAQKFDGRVCGINLPESCGGRRHRRTTRPASPATNTSPRNSRTSRSRRKVFWKSHVVLYANFWPCEWDNDKKYMSRIFEFAQPNRIGLGGPGHRSLQDRTDEELLSVLQSLQGTLALVAMAVQEPTLTYTNPKRKTSRAKSSSTSRRTISAWTSSSGARHDAVAQALDCVSARRADSVTALAGSAGGRAAGAAAAPAGMTREATTAGTACPVSRSQSCASATSFGSPLASAPSSTCFSSAGSLRNCARSKRRPVDREIGVPQLLWRAAVARRCCS